MIEYIELIFVEHLGTTASVTGAFITALFARGAQTSAKAAEAASNRTREQVARIDNFQDLNEASRLLGDLYSRVSSKSWEMCAERSSSIRQIVAGITQSSEVSISKETRSRLAELVAQMKSINNGAIKVLHGGAEPSITRWLKILDDQRETLTIATLELKSLIGETNG